MSKTKSYTEKLTEHLQAEFKGLKLIDEIVASIKDFALEQFEKRKKLDEESKDVLSWGKYKNKKISDVFKLDSSYIKWLSKNNSYLRKSQKDAVEECLK